MPVRSFVLALLLLISATPLGWAAEPAGATIVLQLPPSTSPDAVKGVIADLAAKGALPVTQPAPPGAATKPTITAANLAAQVWDGSKQAVQAVPALGQAPQIWIEKVEAGGGGPGLAFGFWIVAFAGLLAAAPIGMAFRALADRQTRVTEQGPPARWRTAIIWFLAAIASLAVFGLLFSGVLLWVSRGVPILTESADQLVWSALKWRLLITVLLIVLSPRRADLRLLAIDDADARVCFRWVAVYLAAIPLYAFLIWVIERLGLRHDALFGVTLVLGLVITAYKIAMFWAIRYPIARALLAATGQEPGPIRRAVAASWHWFFIALAIVIYLTGAFEIFLGQSTSSVLSAASATTGIVVVVAVLGQVGHNVIARRFLAEVADS